MAVLEDLEEDESYLFALLEDSSGLDLAEFCWKDDNSEDGVWRAWPMQWGWYRSEDRLQVDHAARSLGKSVSIQLRGFAFAFVHPGMEMLITAPELIHLQPVTSAIETRIMSIRLSREMLDKKNRGTGFTHQPFGAQFANGARIMGRIPQRDGKGVKGCMSAGSLVLTRKGLVPIEDIRKGDEVLTHRLRWRSVTANYRYEKPDGFVIRGGGVRELVVSDNHRMWGRRNRNPQRKINLDSPTWVVADNEELSSRWYLGSPVNFPANEIPPEFSSDEHAWIIGRFLADGFTSIDTRRGTSGRVHIIVSEQQEQGVVERLESAGYQVGIQIRPHNLTRDVTICDTSLCRFLDTNFGKYANGKKLPGWIFGGPESYRRELLAGYLSGDGHRNVEKSRWEVGSASKQLAVGVKLLSQSLGYYCSLSWVEVQPNKMCSNPQRSWRIKIRDSKRNGIMEDGILWQKIREVESVKDIPEVYDLSVDEDHSYIADGLISHNQHPLWLELDEGQDYPEPGWIELNETLRYGQEGSVWRAHGVTTGVRNKFYEYTQPESGWKVHRITAMHRPDWSAEEREQKILLYGGRNSPDYKRNILGEHGDQANPLFVLARLMATVDSSQASDYNMNEYIRVDITDEKLRNSGLPIEEFIRVPANHRMYQNVWIGMDVGFTNHPSEILVFAEEAKQKGTGGARNNAPVGSETVLKLVSRWHLERVSAPDQRRVLHELYNVYKPKSIALDSTGNGLPIYQDMMEENPITAQVIKGYNFSSKVAVDWEDAENIEDSLIMRNVLEYASDKLREYVDAGWIKLPWDLELIKEWQGQSFTVVRTTTNPYGKREYSRGSFHSLDAGRMAILGKVLDPIEKILNSRELNFDGVIDKFYG